MHLAGDHHAQGSTTRKQGSQKAEERSAAANSADYDGGHTHQQRWPNRTAQEEVAPCCWTGKAHALKVVKLLVLQIDHGLQANTTHQMHQIEF